MAKYFRKFEPEQPKTRPTGPPPPPTPKPRPNKSDFNCMVASGAIEGPAQRLTKNESPITWQRFCDIATGVGIGLFVGFVAALILIAQINQFPN